MARHTGKEGSITVGGTAVGEITDFSFEERAATIDNRALGLTWDEHTVGSKSWDGTANAQIDPADAGQAALTNGAAVALVLYVEGTSSGKRRYSGNVSVTSLGVGVAGNNEHSTVAFAFKGDGALTIDTVP